MLASSASSLVATFLAFFLRPRHQVTRGREGEGRGQRNFVPKISQISRCRIAQTDYDGAAAAAATEGAASRPVASDACSRSEEESAVEECTKRSAFPLLLACWTAPFLATSNLPLRQNPLLIGTVVRRPRDVAPLYASPSASGGSKMRYCETVVCRDAQIGWP